jgi:outer membrane protein TolC
VKQTLTIFGLGLLLLVPAGCVMGPNYTRPAVPAQATWKERPAETNVMQRLPIEWWTIFNDEQLAYLEAQAVKNNQELKRAVARVTEARAIARVSEADLYPVSPPAPPIRAID